MRTDARRLNKVAEVERRQQGILTSSNIRFTVCEGSCKHVIRVEAQERKNAPSVASVCATEVSFTPLIKHDLWTEVALTGSTTARGGVAITGW